MAPESVVQSIRLIVASVGGTPAGNEQRLIAAVRSRLNGRYEDMSNLEVQLRAFLHGSEPIVHYIQASVPAKTLQDMNKEHFGEFVHRLFLAVAARTRLAGKFAALLDSQQHWGFGGGWSEADPEWRQHSLRGSGASWTSSSGGESLVSSGDGASPLVVLATCYGDENSYP